VGEERLLEHPVVTGEAVLNNVLGLHARAAARLVQVAGRFQSKILLTKEGRTVDAKSILGVLMLSGSAGDRLVISAQGNDAEEAVAALQALIRSRFGESR
jgi:phosphocarrier protein HPr